MSKNKILFVYLNTKGYSLWDRKEYILSRPYFDHYYDKEFFENTVEKRQNFNEDLLYMVGNVGGEFIAQNIETESKVIHEPINIEVLKKEIEDFQPTHIGFSIVLNAYEIFKECVQFVRRNYPQIKILAGDVGALVPETKEYADYVCKGEGVGFVRKILGEDLARPIKIPCTRAVRYRPNPLNPKKYISSPFGILSTDLGCGMGCDFCITYALYRRNYIIGASQEIKDALIKIGDKISQETKKNDIPVILTDPLAFKDEKKWIEVINLMEGENFHFHFNVLTSSSLLMLYSKPGRLLDRFSHSEEMEISFVEVGLESFVQEYAKNRDINWNELVKTLKDFGIVTALSLIIGYDFHDKKNVIQDIETVISFDPAVIVPVNLRILYESRLWDQYEKQNRILSVPPEFRMLWGYQAFIHPIFKPRFQDCLPLMMEVDDRIRSNLGSVYENSLTVIKNRKMTTYNERLIMIAEELIKLKKQAN